MPRALCFDAYDTIVRLDDPAGRLRAGLAAAGVEVDLATAAAAFAAEAGYYRQHSLEGRDPAGLADLRLRCAAILGEHVAQVAPHDLPLDQLVDILIGSLRFVPTPGCVACLTACARQGLPLAVVSNWDCSLPEVLAHVGLAHHFRVIVASAPVGCEKPAPRIWDPALAALGVPAADVWHIGDEPEADGRGALAAGLQPVLVGGARLDGVPAMAGLDELLDLLTRGIA